LEALSYTLSIDQKPAPFELLAALQQIELETSVEEADIMRLRIAIGPRDNRTGWTVVDSGVFDRLTPIRLGIAFGSRPAELLVDVLVTEVSLTFSGRPGESVLNVVAMDISALLNLEEKKRDWPNKYDSDIVKEIFANALKSKSSRCNFGRFGYELVPVVESTSRERSDGDQKVVQRATDMSFLKHLAARNGNWAVYMATNPKTKKIEGHFHPKRLDSSPQGELRVNRGADTNVDRFGVSYNMMLPMIAIGAGTDADTQTEQLGEATSIRQPLLGSKSVLDHSCPRVVLLEQTGLNLTSDLQLRAQADVDRNGLNAIRATGEVTTAAYGGLLLPDRTVTVSGVGPEYSGTYYVESVSHTLSGDGHTQSFSLRRNALGQGG
jgi:hypothetical protein